MTPEEILERAFEKARQFPGEHEISDAGILDNVKLISRNIRNRAGVRLILACSLAKIHKPGIDIRKPYTEIGDADAFSGRSYDEQYIAPFVSTHDLPCNPTTAFLTPALRNRNTVLTPETNLSGRPVEVYAALLQLLDDVYQYRITADMLLTETIRQLILMRDEDRQRMASLIAKLKSAHSDVALSAEQIITIIEQHLTAKRSSRLPALIVAAAYVTVGEDLKETILPLQAHNAADRQTGAIGDLQITPVHDSHIVTCYEMKMRRVTREDIDIALTGKLAGTAHTVDNYIFITTDTIAPEVADYAKTMYEQTGIEFVILDCIGFLRHFLHLFHRRRMQFLDAYQQLVLDEPESAVSQPLKELFLALRLTAESD